MDAVEFFNELNKMCKKYSTDNGCDSKCPLYELESNNCEKDEIPMFDIMRNNPEYLVRIVEKWSQEHPRKTRLRDFLEKYPNAETLKNGTPKICASLLGYCEKCAICGDYSRNCDACWDEPIE